MAIRVTADEVIEIMTNTPDNFPVAKKAVESVITAANSVVDTTFSGDTTIGATTLKEIEKFYSAHLIASSNLFRMTTEEQIDDAKVKYAGQFGKGLLSTGYGQIVTQLDTSGKMSNLSKRSASMRAVVSFDD